MVVRKSNIAFIVAFLLIFFLLTSRLFAASKVWTGTWATAPQLVEPHNMPPAPGLTDNTIRQIVRVSVGGDVIRVRFSNVFGNDSVIMKSVSIAESKGESAINAGSLKKLTFNGRHSVSLLSGQTMVSDPVSFKLKPGSLIAITISYSKVPADITGHPGSRTTSYILNAENDLTAVFNGATTTDHWYFINGIDVLTSKKAGAIAVLGNSIADGRGSGINKQNRWPDVLSAKLLICKKTHQTGVLNLGIGGNCVVSGGLGPTAMNRFDRDILSQYNVKWLIISIGVNDIGSIRTAEEVPVLVGNLIRSYIQMIDKAHAKGIKVYGATILPFAKSFYDKDFRLVARNEVNKWIRESGKFDAVIDFDVLMRNPTDSEAILPDVHDGDFLHPNQEGYKKMGEYVNPDLFR